ncbi:hypothetical protein PR202_gb02462 [Eleusine coracana subsp. coracana]|uniref:Hexosyltransferase n=1 Tax=Eleusine coracana subsp. coracana TaxID=191504 RepID=A0AAV5DZ10_ELECO|nr:hypothetical protein QOZ80_8BG0668270 [Eleusine coracana subsp. coracana]GJN15541.1 hypothetical protein PR202_gb02462 [Eleusine coracana subsp. coracana]
MKTSSLCTPYLLLVALGLLAVLLVVPSRLHVDDLGVLCRGADAKSNNGGHAVDEEAKEFSLLVGVLTMPKRRERRDIVRMAYALQPPPPARVDVRFVFCNVTDPVDAALLAVEIQRHGDVLVLNCTENMNDGKTYAYLSSVPRIFASSPYDYVMKTDDDTYLRVAPLAEELRTKPRQDVYLGYGYPMGGQPMPFMHGMGYVVSWDVATWVATAGEILDRNDTMGPEDLMVGKWLNLGGKGRNRYDLKPRMYDLNWDMDNFRPDTVAVHTLKTNRRWAATFRYFNVTAGIQPSNLYHLP